MRRLVLLASAMIFFDVAFFAAIAPLLPEYVDDLGLSKAQAGLLSASYAAGTLAASLPAGYVASRVGPRRTVIAGLLTLGFASVVFGFAEQIYLLDAARFVQGVAGALIWSGALTWLITSAPEDRRGSVIGTALGTAVAGALLGPALGAVAGSVGTGPVFSSVMVITVLLALAAARLPETHTPELQPLREVVSTLLSRPVVEAAIFVAVPSVVFGAIEVLVPLRIDDLGGGHALIAGGFIFGAALEAVLAPLAGRLSDRVGRRLPFVTGLAICAVAMIAIAAVATLGQVMGALVLTSLGAGLCFAPALTLISDVAEASNLHQGYAAGLSNMAWASGQVIGGIGGGVVASVTGNAVPSLAIALLLAVTVVYAFTAMQPKGGPRPAASWGRPMARGGQASGEWVNWAGDQACRPARIVAPRNRDELAETIAGAAAAGQKVRVAGSGHSFTEAALTEGTMIDAGALSGVFDADRASGLVRVGGGTVLAELNEELARLGLAMENLGDIDSQTISGAISTGTHGTGARLRNISAQVEGLELVLADGSVRHLSAATDPELLRAARVGIGAMGAISAVTLRCVPAFNLLRVDSPHPREEVLDSFQERADAHEHFELFTFPYSDLALVLERNRTDQPARPRGRAAAYLNDVVLENWALGALARTGKAAQRTIPSLARLAGRLASGGRTIDRSDRVFVNERRVRFTEMEYGVPREHGPEAVRRVIEWVRSNEYPVFFPIEMRVAAGDDAFLSPSHERDTAYIAVHQYRGMEWRPYFEAVEAIMDSYGGRPHWGKRHFQTAATLATRYPAWEQFQRARDTLDPGRTFGNEYTERVLGS